ncbi:CPBP family intramembrane glutamic endopeptidase [Mobilicoccus caccae]|uniref:CAAX prenyl protease 2/Lysostaphin resistance protein A-like domain-containing protein n=1 Tax=Mobilicoccus caccae TaxID=1859295 RepID=A0ABQ6ITS7_9MICO|nr:CPBP family intramembrane glutamic endopeptidase [Mobilicoccus caccae]GMA41081.1 hypothetical protein GCM10025883_31260 [Mobilicoccus caccae]
MTTDDRAPASLDARRERFYTWPRTRRGGSYGWGRVVLGFVLVILGCAVIAVVAGSVLGMATVGDGGAPTRPSPVMGTLQAALPTALWGLVALAVARFVFSMRPADLMSHLPGVRWGLLATSTALAFVVFAAMSAVQFALRGTTPRLDSAVLAALVAVVLIVPFQAVSEELLFRALGTQMLLGKIGVSTAKFWIVSLVLSLSFALLHAATNLPVLISLFCFGALFSFVAWKTAGIEAACGIHIANNVVFVAAGLLRGEDLGATQSNATSAVLPLVAQFVIALVVMVIALRLAARDKRTA